MVIQYFFLCADITQSLSINYPYAFNLQANKDFQFEQGADILGKKFITFVQANGEQIFDTKDYGKFQLNIFLNQT